MARIHVGSSTELDKLYFFIAVSVIDPAAAPARKSNAQISFSQIDPSLPSSPVLPAPLDASHQPITDHVPRRCPFFTHPISFPNVSPAFSWHVLFYPLLSVLSRLRLCSEKLLALKVSAKKPRGIQTQILLCKKSRMFRDASFDRPIP